MSSLRRIFSLFISSLLKISLPSFFSATKNVECNRVNQKMFSLSCKHDALHLVFLSYFMEVPALDVKPTRWDIHLYSVFKSNPTLIYVTTINEYNLSRLFSFAIDVIKMKTNLKKQKFATPRCSYDANLYE